MYKNLNLKKYHSQEKGTSFKSHKQIHEYSFVTKLS